MAKPNLTLDQKLAVVADLSSSVSKAVKSNNKARKAKPSKSIELTPEARKALADFRKAKEAEAKAKEAKAEAEAQLRIALGESVEGLVEGVVVIKVVAGRNTHFDRELLLDLFPEAYQATLRSTEYTYLKTL
jgi:predicted phage-related endonuclease